MSKKHAHFEGKEPFEHVIQARLRGMAASQELHGTEIPGHISAFADAAKETALVLLIFWMFFKTLAFPFILGYFIWKVGRSAILGYNRLERLHRLIEEERFEIEHHRAQEREELKAIYATKGLTGKLLEEVTDVLMADDNRLLQVMLEEELGINLESFEHPLKQAFGAGLGVICASLLLFFGTSWIYGVYFFAAFVILSSSILFASLTKIKIIPNLIWNLSVALSAAFISYFAAQL
jgi:hypothetical protein